MTATTITVSLPAVPPAAYGIRIGAGLLEQLGALVRAVAPAPTCGIVSDTNVAPLYLAIATQALEAAGYRVIQHIVPAGEKFKNLQTVSAVLDTFLSARIERATPMIALGGGVVGDLAGFVAATAVRGIPFIQVPTTLLSAVDASVGGKVGADHAAGKNLIGAFHQPRLVLADIATFGTLPAREIRCGLAECIKHAVIRDASLLDFIADNVPAILACQPETMTSLVARNVAIKAAIVAEDPFERAVRALLNFGHTFGHAIENVLEYSGLQHGEAVALGMIAAGRLALALKRWNDKDLERMIELIAAVGLPTAMPQLDVDKTFAAMFTDKKVRGGKLRFVLPTRIGNAEIVENVPDPAVREALATLTRA
jgi:3-dehydroquinate synthase